MSSQRHQQHLSSYLKGKRSSPSKSSSSQSTSGKGRTLHASSSGSTIKKAGKRNFNDEKTVQARAQTNTKQEHRGKPARNADHINRTPDEIFFKIFQFLSPSQLLACAQVCWRWSLLLKDRKLWEGVFPRFPMELRKLFTLFEETQAEDFDWKKEIIQKCIKARKNKFLCVKKKVDPYTGLPADAQKNLKDLSIQWRLCLTDTRGQSHWSTAEETTYFASSLSTRWLSLQLPSLVQLKEMKIFACVPVFFDKSWKPHTKSATTRSLILHYDLKAKGVAIRRDKADTEGNMISAHFLPPGILVTCWTASWKDGGEIAFVTACFSYHQLLERVMLGSSTMIYKAPPLQPVFDDVDPQYGLHGYSAMVELRNHKSSYWSQQFRELYHNGFTSDSVVLRGLSNEYGIFSKKLSLPWKTELFRNTLQNTCLFDMTIVDEHRRAVWCVSSPVLIHVNKEANVDYSAADGDCLYMEYYDEHGRVHMEFLWSSSEEQTRVVDVEFRMRKSSINSWFGTTY